MSHRHRGRRFWANIDGLQVLAASFVDAAEYEKQLSSDKVFAKHSAAFASGTTHLLNKQLASTPSTGPRSLRLEGGCFGEVRH
jgi:hypothetical protein